MAPKSQEGNSIRRRICVVTRVVTILTACLAAGGTLAQPSRVDPLESPRVQLADQPQALPDFTLTDHDERRFCFSSLRGNTVLVFFGFTHCQGVCPPTMQKLRQVSRALASEDSLLTALLISVDGERDSPEVMKAYLQPFMPNFIGLTGDPAEVREIAASFPAVFFKGLPKNREGEYDVEHSSQVYLIDGEGLLRATFYNAEVEEMISVTGGIMAGSQ